MDLGAAHAAAWVPAALDLLVPGLLGPIPIPPDDVPAAPTLARLLSRGTPLSGGVVGLTEALFTAFGLPPTQAPTPSRPSGPICHLADAPEGGTDGYWFHADPVHLRLDRDRLMLYDARQLDLTQAEADALVTRFNAHFADDGLALEAPVPGRWYLRLADVPGLSTWPLDAVVGRSVAPFLPTGNDARRWVRILNEVQMLFAQAETNRRREAEGRLPVSGIWLWGGGELPRLRPPSRYGSVFADHPLAVGLAKWSGVVCQPLAGVERVVVPAVSAGPVLVVWHRVWPAVLDADPSAWARELVRLESWVRDVQRLLASRRLEHCTLDACDGSPLRIARLDRWRIWRRVRPLSRLLDQDARGNSSIVASVETKTQGW